MRTRCTETHSLQEKALASRAIKGGWGAAHLQATFLALPSSMLRHSIVSPALLNGVMRQTSRFARQPSWLALCDLMVGPIVDDFVFEQALRMSEKDLLTGARGAACAVNEAMAAAACGDGGKLDELKGSLAPSLHAAMWEEVRQLRTDKTEERLQNLNKARRKLEEETPSLVGTLLIIGAQRDQVSRGAMQHRIGGGADEQQQLGSRLSIGSHLIVCDRSAHRLWSTARQTELLSEHGCSVHCMVSFGDQPDSVPGSGELPHHMYTFEMAVDGEVLLGRMEKEPDFSLAVRWPPPLERPAQIAWQRGAISLPSMPTDLTCPYMHTDVHAYRVDVSVVVGCSPCRTYIHACKQAIHTYMLGSSPCRTCIHICIHAYTHA